MHNCFEYHNGEYDHIVNTFPGIFYAKEKSKQNLFKKEWIGYISKWTIGFDQVLLKEDEIKIRKISRVFQKEKFDEGSYNWLKYSKDINQELKKNGN